MSWQFGKKNKGGYGGGDALAVGDAHRGFGRGHGRLGGVGVLEGGEMMRGGGSGFGRDVLQLGVAFARRQGLRR